jgi:alanyl-tRNA synthetase
LAASAASLRPRRWLPSTLVIERYGSVYPELPEHADRIPAEVAFHLYDTDGLPIELTSEIAAEAGVSVDIDGFERLLAQHRQRSRPQRDPSAGQAQP